MQGILFRSEMESPQLNVDVLTIVCEFLADVSDVLSVSLTCSSVHVVAVRWLLLTRPVHLKSGASIRRFHSFLFDDEPARAPYIRALDIDLMWPRSEADDATLLLSILASCKCLQKLTIAFQQDAFPIVASPPFLDAIAAIPSLRSFIVRSQIIDALVVLSRFSTPVRMLGIHTNNLPDVTARSPAFIEQRLPRAVVRTLEELELDQLTLDLYDDVEVLVIRWPSALDAAPYPAVHSLSVGLLKGRPMLGSLQHLFPALDGTLELGALHMARSEAVHARLRTANQHAQQRDADGSSPAWKKLDRIVCDAPMLYVLALRCPIRLAMLEFGLVREHGRYAADALRENPVPRLKLTTNHELGPAFGALFSPELAGTLTHLTLCLLYKNDCGLEPPRECELQWETVLASLVSALQPLSKLTHLRVVIGASVYVYKEASWPFAPWGEYAHSFRGSAFDWEGTAAALSGAVPSLQNVFLTTGGFLSNWEEPPAEDPDAGGLWKPYERWYITRGWRVANVNANANAGSVADSGRVPGGERGLVELHEDVAGTIIRNEELVLSELDQCMAAPRLKTDELAIVCEFLTEVSDILSIALTCSSVRSVAVGWLLRMRPIYLKSGPFIRRFHSFLFVDAPAHAPHVRAVHTDVRWPQAAAEDDCSPVLDILTSCKRVEFLTLAFRQGSVGVIANPHFLQAITAIQSLRSLSLRSESSDALSFLPHFRIPLRRLRIESLNISVSARFPVVLEQFLPRVAAQTLGRLELDKFAVDPHGINGLDSLITPSAFATMPYPSMRSLSVGSFQGKPLLDHLQHFFPALDGTLDLGFHEWPPEETYVYLRATNQRSQENDREGLRSHAWKKLDRIICDGQMVYILGLRCPIRVAIVFLGGVHHHHHHYTADALR
ncbi:hypothetical protein V8D89_002933 [Ganoderma adspersum]